MTGARFRDRYGPRALVAGGTEGLGESFSRALARRGLDLTVVARRESLLGDLAARIRDDSGVDVETIPADLADPEGLARVVEAAAGEDVGLLVYNAAQTAIGPFLDTDLERHLRIVDVNVRAPLTLCHAVGRRLMRRGRGGLVLMSSMSGLQGTALVASYAATKAFDLVLAEGLWDEMRDGGVDVLACVAGPTSTPGYAASRPADVSLAPPPLSPDRVAEEALNSLGRRPGVIPGARNAASAFLMQRLLPRRWAVRATASTMRKMYGEG